LLRRLCGAIGANADIQPRFACDYGYTIRIGDGVSIGGGAIILPGVTIGDGCVIGAGSVVRHDIPAGSLAVGNPARIIRSLG
jgi:maltose O-acetyltransferase